MPRARRWPVVPQSVCTRIKVLLLDHDQKTVSEMTGIAQSEISKIKARGFREATIKRCRPMPESFPVMAKRLTFHELMRHYRAGSRAIVRWKKELLDPVPNRRGDHFRNRPKKKRALPIDFEERQREMTIVELKAHYGAGAAQVKAWMAQCKNPRPMWNGRNRPMEKVNAETI